MITRKIDVGVVLTPEELAAEFWGLDAKQQARFFNYLGLHAPVVGFSTQMQLLTEEERLMDEGRWAMNKIGEYANHG